MKKLIALSLMLSLCFPLFSQVYDVAFNEDGEPYGVKIFNGESFRKFKFDEPSSQWEYEIELDGKSIVFDLSHYMPGNQEPMLNNDEGTLDIFEPGETPEGDLIRTFAFSPDGNILAALYQHSDNVYFFNTTNYELLGIVDVGREPMDITMTADFAYVCCHTSNEVNIIQLSDFSISNSFEVYYSPCQIEVNNDESIVYVACNSYLDGSLAAYNSNTGSEIFHRNEPFIHREGYAGSQGRRSYSFTEFSLSPNSEFIVAINTVGQDAVIINASTGDLIKNFDFGGAMKSSGFSGSGDTLYIYTTQHPDSMSLHRIDINDFVVIDSIVAITAESGIISHDDLAINADGTKVLTGGDWWNGRYCLFDFNTHTYQYINDGFILGSTKIYTSFDNKYVISQVFGLARLIDLETGQIINQTPEGMMIGLAGAISPTEELIVLGDGPFYSLQSFPDEKFYAFDFSDHLNFNTDTIIYSGIVPEADMTNCAVLSNDGNKLIATNTLSDNISFIDYTTGLLDTLIYMEGVTDVRTIPLTDYVIVSGQDASDIKIIDLTDHAIISDIPAGETEDIFVTADGEIAYAFNVISSDVSTVQKIELDGSSSQIVGEVFVNFSNCAYHNIYYGVDMYTSTNISPDGNYMLFAGNDDLLGDIISIVDTRFMEVVSVLSVSNNCVYDYAFTDDSKRVCALTYGYQGCIIYLDGENSYVESEFTLTDGSFSADYNPVDDLFYILLKLDWLCQVDPYTGEIIDQLAVPSSENLWQVCINQTGIPLIRSTENIIFEIESYALPGVSLDFTYVEDMDKFIVPIPGPDKVCVFDPLIIGVNTFPQTPNNDNVNVFPNPANDEIHISSETIIESVKICDANGRIIYFKECNNLNTSVSVNNYKEGVYFIVIKNESGISTQKIIIAH